MSLQTQISASGLPSAVPASHTPVAGTTIPVTTAQVHLGNTGAVSMTASPAVQTSGISAGTRLTLLQTAAGGTTLTSGGSSGLQLASSSRTIAQYQTLVLVFDGTYWCEESFSASGGGGGGGTGVVPFNTLIDDVNTIYLLPGTGTTGSTTMTNNGFISSLVTPFGNTQIAATPSKWGGGSIYADGSGDYLTSLNQNDYLATIGTGDFTYESWVYLLAYTGSPGGVLFDTRDPATGYAGVTVFINSTGVAYWANNSLVATSTSSVPLTGWHHVAVVRSSGVVTFYVDGVACGTVANTTSFVSRYLSMLGQFVAGPQLFLNGYFNDMRISSVARYTSNFAPGPTAALPLGYNPAYLPSSPAAGQLALSSNAVYACTNATGPTWKRTSLSSI